MKKYIFAALAAICSFGLVSCDDDEVFEQHLDAIQLSQTIVTLPQEGGEVEVTLKAKAPWTIDEESIGDVFTISPLSGEAGEHTLVIRAEAAELAVSADVVINCAGREQHLMIEQQGLSFPDFEEGQYWIMFNVEGRWIAARPCTATIGDGSSYAYIFCDEATGSLEDGTLASSAANVYTFTKTNGGFYVSDSEGGYLWQSGSYNNFYRATAGGSYVWSVAQVGDYAYRVESNTSHVLCYSPGYSNVAAYASLGENLRPYLVPVRELAPDVISVKATAYSVTAEAGTLTVAATITAESLDVDCEADWIRYTGNTATGLVFAYTANVGAARTATIKLHGVQGEYEKEVEISVVQGGSAGTLDLPMTPEEAIAAAQAGATYAVYVKGIVSKLERGGYGAQYGNGSFWISADGNFNDDPAQDFEVYQANWLGGEKWTESNAQIAEGAEVIVYGPLTMYNGTAETQGKGAAHVYSVNGVLSDANGIGSMEAPFNVAGAIAAANAGVGVSVYVEGIVSELYKGGFDAAYGNGSFYMSADGVRHNDNALDFEAYQVNYLQNEKWVEGVHPQIEVGDAVTIYGPLTLYNGLAETKGKGAGYLYKLNGKTE